jgi:hypothetical protein
VDLGAGGDEGVGAAIARGVGAGCRASGVSDGLGDADFLGVFSGAGLCFFFFDLGFGVGVSSAAGVFFFFALGFFGVAFGFGLRLGDGDSSGDSEADARVFKNFWRFCFSSSVSWA